MHAVKVLQKSLSSVFSVMHAARARALLGAVSCVIASRRLILMDLARAWPGAERVRAPLKCLDRLLSNPHLQQESQGLYAGMARWLLRGERPIIVIDWSDLQPNGRWYLLRAGVPIGGRTLTLWQEVHAERHKQTALVQRRFLKRLQRLLPAEVKPILITDAGFERPWFRAVRALGWDYLGRVKGRNRVRVAWGQPLIHVRALFAQASAKPQRLHRARLGRLGPWECDLVLYRAAPRGRIRRMRRGQRSHGRRSVAAERRTHEPWVLATSLEAQQFGCAQIVALYRLRMQIEESFRDLKCERFGCAFKYSLTRQGVRLAMLLLLHALACFVVWLMGQTLSASVAGSRYGGVRSTRARAHYSLLRLGWEALRHHDPCGSPRQLWATLRRWFTQGTPTLQIST